MGGNVELIVRLVLASLLGGIIGLEREVHGREAGIRTYLLVALGSALIMLVSEYMFLKYRFDAAAVIRIDPGRVAAQAITGIGFLGAGVILRYKGSIRGLTTAACMWVACAIGLAIGAGQYIAGTAVSTLTVLALTGLKGVEKRLNRDWYRELVVLSEDRENRVEQVEMVVKNYNAKITGFSIKKDFQKKEILMSLRLRVRSSRPFYQEILGDVSALGGIKEIELR
jgi:putative Mg2+ transporter-C (MgtC) family protein